MTAASGSIPAALTEQEVLAQPDNDQRSVLLRAFTIEQLAHTDFGWDDVEPVLFVFARSGSGLAGIKPIQLPTVDGGPDARLAAFADQVQIAELLQSRGKPFHYLGLGIIFEAWLRDLSADEQLPDRSLGDTPGSVEARVVAGVLADGQDFFLHRVRGQQPQVYCSGRGEMRGFHAAGLVHGPLVVLHERVQGHRIGSALGQFLGVDEP